MPLMTTTNTVPQGKAQPGNSRMADQAEGLRQMFATRVLRFVPVVANPGTSCGGLVLERLCTAYASLGLHTLVVDASQQARQPAELAEFDLSEGVEALSTHVSYMAARGLPLRFADARGRCDALLDALGDASPQADVVLVHASASELVRVFAARAKGHNLRPLLFTNDLAEGLRDAYAAVKVMSQRGNWMAYDLLVCASTRSQQAQAVAERLARCSDDFLGVAQRSWQLLDPREPAMLDPRPRFLELAGHLLQGALPHALGDTAFDQLMSPGAALPSRAAPVLN
jgi:hypothetical protein